MDVILQGLLGKKKEKSFWSLSDSELLWNDYWCFVSVDLKTDEYQFSYAKNKGEKKPKWSIDMKKIKDVFIVDDDQFTFEISMKKNNKKKKLLLRCISQNEFETWINVLTRCIDGVPSSSSSAASSSAASSSAASSSVASSSAASSSSSAANKTPSSTASTVSASSTATLSTAEKTEARLKKELAKAKEKAEKVAAMREAQKVTPSLPPTTKSKSTATAVDNSRVEKDLAAAKAKAELRKTDTTATEQQPAAKQEPSPEALAKLKARAEREISEARKRAAERIAKQQALEAESKRKKEVEVQELSPAALEQREQELALARKKAEERTRKQKEKADLEKRANEIKPVVIDPETEARLQAQREQELEEARKKAEARVNAARSTERKSTSSSARSPSPAARKGSTKTAAAQPRPSRSINVEPPPEEMEGRLSASNIANSGSNTPRGSENESFESPPSPRTRDTVKPTSEPVKPRVTGVICELCDEAPAVVSCQDCGLKLCFDNGCDEDIHKGGKSRHERIEIEMKSSSFSKMVVCYLCGQQFTHLSLQIHYDSCRIKRKLLYKGLPEHLRPRFPPPPSTPMPNDNSSKQEFKAFNDECAVLAKESMVVCPNEGCGRRFEPDRIEVHLRGCRFRERSRMD